MKVSIFLALNQVWVCLFFLDMLVRLAVLLDGSLKIFKLLFLLNLHLHILVKITQVYKFC